MSVPPARRETILFLLLTPFLVLPGIRESSAQAVEEVATSGLRSEGARILGIDFNTNSMPGAPTQSGFRGLFGLQNGANGIAFSTFISGIQITITKTGSADFNFRGFNARTDRAMPGGPCTLSALVADFIATSDGPVTIGLSGLPAGDYVFRSWHLEPFTGTNFGFASGSSPADAQRLEIEWNGSVQSSVVATCLGQPGLNSTSIHDSDIPQLAFIFTATAGEPVEITLRGIYSSGQSTNVFVNGFEIREAGP